MPFVEFPTIYELQDVVMMKKIVLASLMTVAMGGAFAQVYLGGAIGMTNVNESCDGTTACDRDDTGYKLYAGYKFTPNVAIEAGYADFGKAKLEGYAYGYKFHAEMKSTAPFLAAAFHADFTPHLNGVARLGLANVESTIDTTLVFNNQALPSQSETKLQPLFGLGLGYSFTKNVKMTLEADFTKTAEFQGESDNMRMISIGAQYSF
jgi:OOP family OmpA-OmpF porin